MLQTGNKWGIKRTAGFRCEHNGDCCSPDCFFGWDKGTASLSSVFSHSLPPRTFHESQPIVPPLANVLVCGCFFSCLTSSLPFTLILTHCYHSGSFHIPFSEALCLSLGCPLNKRDLILADCLRAIPASKNKEVWWLKWEKEKSMEGALSRLPLQKSPEKHTIYLPE
jgi:hypothetical protein